jgi:hypothetical protein
MGVLGIRQDSGWCSEPRKLPDYLLSRYHHQVRSCVFRLSSKLSTSENNFGVPVSATYPLSYLAFLGPDPSVCQQEDSGI